MDQIPTLNQALVDAIQQLKLELLSHFDATMDNIERSLNTINAKLSTLGDHVSELELVAEQAKGRDVAVFMRQLLPSLLSKENFTSPLILDKVHRTPTFRHQDTKAGSRPVLVKLLNFQDKVKILRLAREKKELVFNSVRVHIFPDFSTALL